MEIKIEIYGPWVCAIILTLVSCLILRNSELPATSHEVLASVLGISSIVAGFTATAQSIMLANKNSIGIKYLRETVYSDTRTYFDLAISYTLQTMYLSISLAIFSGFLLFLNPLNLQIHPSTEQKQPVYFFDGLSSILTATWLFLVFSMFTTTLRIVSLYGKMLRQDT